MTTHSSILAWRIPWAEKPVGYSPWGHKELDMTERLKVFLGAQLVKNLPAVQETWVQSLGWEDPLEKQMATHSSILGLENLRYSGAWWAAVHGVAKSRA